jgi:ATP-dependent Clp protease ATP-binding subunit ClpB
VTAAATAALASEGYDPQFGARPLKRVIQHRIENALAGKILAGEIGDGASVRVDYQGKSFTFTKVEQNATDANTRRDVPDATAR